MIGGSGFHARGSGSRFGVPDPSFGAWAWLGFALGLEFGLRLTTSHIYIFSQEILHSHVQDFFFTRIFDSNERI